MSEEEYNQRSLAGDRKVIRNGERLYGDMFYYLDQDEEDPCNFINHSTDANAILFMSFLFSLRNIEPGEEITVDYTLNTSAGDVKVLSMPRELIGDQSQAQHLVHESITRLVKALKERKSR